ncbi:MAG: SDR family oxidoreductase [Acidimicrobiales bacterium]
MAVVTGGSRGIGAATAAVLARQGWSVAGGYLQNAGAARSVADACADEDPKAVALPVDVASEDSVVRFFAAVDEELGQLWALINMIGVVGPPARVDEYDAGRVTHLLAVNAPGSILCARAAVRRMSPRHGGAVVDVSSAAARPGSPGEYVDDAASKGAIDTFSLGLAREVAAEGIRVNAVRPGLIRTEIRARGGQPDRLARLAPFIPIDRVGEAPEVAHTSAWLCSEGASYVTGALIDVSGGR